jgi:glutathione S-transferase
MRKLIHLTLSPASRLARLMVGEKRLACDPVASDDSHAHLPVFVELASTRREGPWAIMAHLEGNYPEHPLTPKNLCNAPRCCVGSTGPWVRFTIW